MTEKSCKLGTSVAYMVVHSVRHLTRIAVGKLCSHLKARRMWMRILEFTATKAGAGALSAKDIWGHHCCVFLT